MDKEEFSKMFDEKKFQVFIFRCPCNIPFNIFSHTWFVINKKGKLSRWEVLFRKKCKSSWGHLHKNYFQLADGIDMFLFKSKFIWDSKLIGIVDKNSLAKKMINLIEKSKNEYPYRDYYNLLGPNSNTYVQWILNHFPKIKIKLPWNAVGKKYKTNIKKNYYK